MKCAAPSFGRWQLPALMQTVAGLAEAMVPLLSGDTRPGPRGPTSHGARYVPARPTLDRSGAIGAEPDATYRPGESVEAVFVSAIPEQRPAPQPNLSRGGPPADWVRLPTTATGRPPSGGGGSEAARKSPFAGTFPSTPRRVTTALSITGWPATPTAGLIASQRSRCANGHEREQHRDA